MRNKGEPSYADFLDQLFACEVEARRTRYLRARLQLAHLPFLKTFEQFDFSFQPSIDERQCANSEHCASFMKPVM
jgi:DNA replication protein DnaC